MTAMLFASASPLVTAHHSDAVPPEFWDCNGDHVADDTCVLAKRAGAPWIVEAATRLDKADDEWRNKTDFDINTSTSSGQPVYRDRLASCLSTWQPDPDVVILAVVCVQHVWTLGEYYRITGTPTYFNHRLPDYELQWYYAAALPPNPDPSLVHFGGVAVHEFGH